LVLYRRANVQYVEMSRKHVTPIWFVIIGERVYMRAQDYKVKVGLAAKGKACVVIDDGDKYRELRGAVMWGKSKIVTDKKLIARITELFDVKYSERQWKADEMPMDWVRERNKEKRAFIEFIPEKVDSWDNSKLSSAKI
jgi:hypothetical protein